MEHEECRENLSAYLDGELPPQGRLAVEAHLAGCPACAAELAGLRGVSAAFKAGAERPLPPGLKAAVLEAARPASPFKSFLKPALAFSAAAAAVLVVFNVTKTPEEAAMMSVGFGSREGGLADMAALSADAGRAGSAAGAGTPQSMEPAAGAAANAAPGPVAAARHSAGFTAAGRGAYGQAKFAAKSGSVALVRGSLAAPAAKRAAPPRPEPVILGGVTYRALHWRDEAGGARNGGSVAAVGADGAALWAVRIYEVSEDPALEAGVQQVHIAALAAEGGLLLVTDERGRRYALDPATRRVTRR